MKQFSIIIPYYNSSLTLEKAISSIDKYFYEYNFEILVVNDGSDDNIDVFEKKYIERKNIIFISQKNKGVSSARNKALDRSQGKYICFLDADDIFYNFDVRRIIEELDRGSHLICFGYKVVSERNTVIDSVEPEQTRHNVFKNTIYPEIVCKHSVGGHVTNKVFLNSIIRNYHLRFRENISFAEDLVFVTEYLNKIQMVSTFETSMYYLLAHESSIRGSVNKPNKKQLLKLASVVEANYYISESQLDIHSKKWFASESFYMFVSLLHKSKQFEDAELDEQMRIYKQKIKSELVTFLFYKKTRFSILQRFIGIFRYVWY